MRQTPEVRSLIEAAGWILCGQGCSKHCRGHSQLILDTHHTLPPADVSFALGTEGFLLQLIPPDYVPQAAFDHGPTYEGSPNFSTPGIKKWKSPVQGRQPGWACNSL